MTQNRLGIDRCHRPSVLIHMSKVSSLLVLFALGCAACASAHADRLPNPTVSVEKSPYRIELIGSRGEVLDTYQHRGRFYVEGGSGARYSIRVTNPTNLRVEAVVSVDGLDVIDGETADFRNKRGYIVPAFGSLVIDGYRVSTQAVAAFRFSSVSSSYAGRKGKARNVGVVGVAIFSERARPELIVPMPVQRREKPRYHRHFEDSASSPGVKTSSAEMDSAEPAPPSARPRVSSTRSIAPSRRPVPQPDFAKKKDRAGLGTAYGEHRHSAVQFTRFQRASAKTPTSFAQLRYNNSAGLQALGIVLHRPAFDADEIAIREAASPFPNSRFAQPPR